MKQLLHPLRKEGASMRKYLAGLATGLIALVLVSCANAGGTSVYQLDKAENGDLVNIPVIRVHTTTGLILDCIMIENGNTSYNNYSLAMDCNWPNR